MKAYSKEKKELIQSFQDAIGNSEKRLEIIKKMNKRESIKDLSKRLKISQPMISKAITRFKSHNLITLIKKSGKSEIYDKIPLLKTFSNLDSLVRIKLDESEMEKKEIKRKFFPPSKIPFLDHFDEKKAEEMSNPYTLIYLFENSLRKFIDKELTKKHGMDWWDKIGVKRELKKKVSQRKEKEGLNRWHVPRGASEIFYTDLSDLPYLLNKESSIFEKKIDLTHWTTTINISISLSRNIVDHHNPLPKREIDRLRMILDDWKKQFS